jgi:methionyl-tRNA formyltransferase
VLQFSSRYAILESDIEPFGRCASSRNLSNRILIMSTRIVFMGSPEFALPTLSMLAQKYELAGVVTQPDRPAGRGRALTPPPVRRLADSLGLPVIQPRRLREPEAMAQIQNWRPEAIVVAAFGQILRPDVLNLPRFGCINVHASLLPRWRGAAPIQAALLNGDAETGITIMKMDPGIDTGPVINQRSIPVQPDDTAGTLSERLAQLGADLLADTLPAYIDGRLTARPQPEDGATYAPMLKKEEGLLDFEQPAEALARKVRAYNPWPGAFTLWQGENLKIHRAHGISPSGNRFSPGAATVVKGLPAIGTGEGLLILDEVQPAGKKPMPGDVFLRGARGWGE